MVKPRRFTATELRELARGCRLLANLDLKEYENRKGGFNADGCLESKKLHEEMAEICEQLAQQREMADHAKRAREVATTERAIEKGTHATKTGGEPNVLRFKRGPRS